MILRKWSKYQYIAQPYLEMLVILLRCVDMAHVQSTQREEGVKMAEPTWRTDWLTAIWYPSLCKACSPRPQRRCKRACLIPKLWGWTEFCQQSYILYIYTSYRTVTGMRQLKVEVKTRNSITQDQCIQSIVHICHQPNSSNNEHLM